MNLKQAGELPTADAYAARIREETWLAAQRDQNREAADQRRTEEAAKRDKRQRESRKQAEARRRERAQNRDEARERLRGPLKVLALSLLGFFVVVGIAAAAWHFTGWDAPVLGVSPLREDSQEATSSLESDTEATTDTSTATEAPTGRQKCETIQRGDSYVRIEATGVACSEAEQLGREIASGGGPPAGYDCSGNTGLTCTKGDTEIYFGIGSEPSGLSEESPVTTEGIGPVLTGMSLSEAEAAADAEFVAEGPELNPGCQYFRAEGLEGVNFMVSDGEIAVVNVSEPGVATLSDVGVGSSEADALAAYGDQVEVRPSELNPEYSELTFTPDDPADETRMVLSSDGSSITGIRAGRLPEVGYIEGCV